MDNLVIKKIQNYLPKKVFLLRTSQTEGATMDHVFSDLSILAEKLSTLFISESNFHAKGADLGFNGPIEFTEKQEFINFIAKGYNSGWYSFEFKGDIIHVDIYCLEIDTDLRI